MRKVLSIFIPLTFFLALFMNASSAFAQPSDPFEKHYDKVHKLIEDEGLPKSALEYFNKNIKDKVKASDKAQHLKMEIYALFLHQMQAESDTSIISELLEKANNTKDPVSRAIWSSVAARQLNNYFSNHSWEILQRSEILEQGDDFTQWTERKFSEETTNLYLQSLQPEQALKDISIQDYSVLYQGGKGTSQYRLTLYDMLASDALEYLGTKHYRSRNARVDYLPQDTLFFVPATEFLALDIAKYFSNKESKDLLILTLYQDLMRYHYSINNIGYAVYLDLKRLDFVNSKTSTAAKAHYINALEDLVKRYPNVAETDLARVNLFEYQHQQAISSEANTKINLPDIADQLQEILNTSKFQPALEKASLLLNVMHSAHFQVSIEEVILPSENAKMFVSYTNSAELHYRIYKLSYEMYFSAARDVKEMVKNAVLVTEKKLDLPFSKDMRNHSTEFNLGKFDLGLYVLVAAHTASDLLADGSHARVFSVSKLTVVESSLNEENAYHVLDRKDGKPLPDAKFSILNNEYSKRRSTYEWKLNSQFSLNKDAQLLLPESRQARQAYIVSHGNDTLMGDMYRWRSAKTKTDVPTLSLIFTDRAVYRPGQKVQVKGIVYQEVSNEKKEVRAGHAVRVALYDVNGQEVPGAVDIKTNDFGSYIATFTIPEGRLNGTYTVRDGLSTQHIRVEEYKRPQFLVSLENLQGDYSLGSSVVMKGNARTYSGVGVSAADVRYSIYRYKTMPYWRPYMRIVPFEEELISSGTVQTDAAGEFAIPFVLKADPYDKPEDGMIYSYRVDADVTDISGEMQSATNTLSAGFQSFLIRLNVPDLIVSGKESQIKASITNHSGAPLQKTADFKVYKLVYPGTFKARLWNKPSEQQFTKEAHRRLFPTDEYEHESDPNYWEKIEIISEKGILLENLSKYLSRQVIKEAGYYALEISLPDDAGVRIHNQQVFYYHIPGAKLAEVPLFLAIDTTIASPQEEIEVDLLSDDAKQHVLWFEGNLDKSQTSIKTPSSFKLNIDEKDRGGKILAALAIRNNRVYSKTKTIDVPWVNKQLNVTWAAHRDKLAPGAEEEWTFTIKDHQNKAQAAEFVAVLYDASLDKIAPLVWPGNNLYKKFYAAVPSVRQHFSTASIYLYGQQKAFGYEYSEFSFPSLRLPYLYRFNDVLEGVSYSYRANNFLPKSAPTVSQSNNASEPSMEMMADDVAVNQSSATDEPKTSDIRTNFSETALFAPQLRTNEQGETEVKFSMPESLTTWNLMGFAHTKDLKTGSVSGSVITHKDLMIQPNMPRFFRQNDQVVLRARVSNISDKNLSGTAQIELLDAETRSSIAAPFNVESLLQYFSADAGANVEVKWAFSIPNDLVKPVLVRITAKAGNFTDGEEHLIPVLTNRLYVTEALTLPFIGSGQKTFTLKTMHQPSATRTHAGLTFEFTSNPAWYVVQALPYLIEYPYECTEQVFNKLYANAVSTKIIDQNPSIAGVFAQWKEEGSSSLQSALQKNESLKSALLQETPWVQEAQNEAEQKQRIALLLDPSQTKKSLQDLSEKLKTLQHEDGAWGWFAGMAYNEYISNYILAGWGKLDKMQAITPEMKSLETSMHKAVEYADRQLVLRFERLKQQDKKWRTSKYFSEAVVQYFYMRSFYPQVAQSKESKEAYEFFYKKIKEDMGKMPLMLKAQMAIVLHRHNDQNSSKMLIQSLYENSVFNADLGRYWPSLRASYYWQELPIESQSTIIEAFAETGLYPEAIEEMKVWLLKQKQTSHWGTTTSTADACYALLATGDNWLSESPEVLVTMGAEEYSLSEKSTEAGSGYFIKKYEGQEVSDDMSTVSISVQQPQAGSKRPSWGALYWQYFEDADKVEAFSGPIKIERKLYRVSLDDKGKVLEEINNNTVLKPGDRVTVRVMIRSDRNMEFVHLKDQRAAGFEPVDVLSGFMRSGSLWHYRSIGDASVNFFFDYLPQGTHTFEYELKVNASGTYNHGMATIQCMYAPEFGAHTSGSTFITVD